MTGPRQNQLTQSPSRRAEVSRRHPPSQQGREGVARTEASLSHQPQNSKNIDKNSRNAPSKHCQSKTSSNQVCHNCSSNDSKAHKTSTNQHIGHNQAANQRRDGRGQHRLSSHSVDSTGSGSSGASNKSDVILDSPSHRCSSAGTTVSAREVHLTNADLTPLEKQ